MSKVKMPVNPVSDKDPLPVCRALISCCILTRWKEQASSRAFSCKGSNPTPESSFFF